VPRLFEPNVVYPSDRTGGGYVEFEGPVVEVGDPLDTSSGMLEMPVVVRTEKGDFRGWTNCPSHHGPLRVGDRATIRVYDSGGGWYPDDRIVGWTRGAAVSATGS
jgi:hypothetical protein